MDENLDGKQVDERAVKTSEDEDRREALRKLGKFSALVAPFSVLAFTKKAAAATGGGPRKHQ